jgi:hypothetical protein
LALARSHIALLLRALRRGFRGQGGELRLHRLYLRGDARVIAAVFLLRRLELLNGVGMLAKRLVVTASQLIELFVDARKIVRDGLERLRQLGGCWVGGWRGAG